MQNNTDSSDVQHKSRNDGLFCSRRRNATFVPWKSTVGFMTFAHLGHTPTMWSCLPVVQLPKALLKAKK
jgi:hypothetical protein